ncbi:hypothetical protein K501DRAFT_314907 [Backusella circina FSU 941]|nr:hypothetical protein K501DRAFT_314907 [Backusella circina FSU 941]
MIPYSNIISYNLIRLTAASNYKLAQLTFEEPSRSTLQKTTHVKKMLDELYSRIPPDWLSQMVRWEFLTAEPLEDMTPKEIEMIIDRYKEIIRHFPGNDVTLNMTTATNMEFATNNRYTIPSNGLFWSPVPSTFSSMSPPTSVKVSFSQRLAKKLGNLFDMEFTLDLSAANENFLDNIVEIYPREERVVEGWSFMEPNCRSVYEPSINSSFELSESDEDDMSNSSTPPGSILSSSIYTNDYIDLFDSLLEKKRSFGKAKSSLSKKKKQKPKEKGLGRSPSVASKILKRLSPF